MSTILDALRKLQRERERAKPPRNLQESVTQPLSVTRSPRGLSRRFVGVGGIGLLCLLAGGVLIWKWPALRGATPEVPPSASQSEPSATHPLTQPRVTAPTRRTRPRPAVARQRRRAAPKAVAEPEFPLNLARGVTPNPEQSLDLDSFARVMTEAAAEQSLVAEPLTARRSSPEKKAASARPRGTAAEKAKPARTSRISGRRQRDRRPSSKETTAAAAPKPPAAASAVTQRSKGEASTPAPNAPPKSAPKTTVKPVPPPAQVTEAERRTPPEPNPFMQPFEPVTRVERAPAETQEPDAGRPSLVFTDFPELALESVRWHPDPSRRVANLVVDRGRGITVREGDIVRGALIHRIDPGAVELRVGTAKKMLQMEP